MTTRIGIVSDVHNRKEKLYQALLAGGFIYADWTRVPNTYLIQIGDLVSLGYDEQEADFYDQVFDLFDEVLIGNHELVAFHFDRNLVMFDGFHPRPGLDTWMGKKIVKDNGFKIGADPAAVQAVIRNFMREKYTVATTVGKWLITHAGVTPYWQKQIDQVGIPREAKAYAEWLEGLFYELQVERRSMGLIDGIPSNRGGMYKSTQGGIFWTDFLTLRAGYANVHVPQIVGHTHLDNPPDFHKSGNLIGIDTNGGVCVLITEDDGETFTSVVID